MSQRTQLASGALNGSDQLLVEMLERTGKPTVIRIVYPMNPSVTRRRQFDQVVAAMMRILANAVIELAAIRAQRRP